MHADDHVEGAAVDAARLHLVDGEGPTQQHARLLAPDTEGDEVPGTRDVGDAGRRERQHLVGADPADVEHLALDLNRHV